MIKQHFTYRLLPKFSNPNELYTPYLILKNNFTGLDFNFKLNTSSNIKKDGRYLGYIEAETQDIIDTIIESLAMFGAKAKTKEKATEFINKMKK